MQMLLNGYDSHSTGKKKQQQQKQYKPGSFVFFHFISSELCFIKWETNTKGLKTRSLYLKTSILSVSFRLIFQVTKLYS